jgi:hypothetical protein
MTATYQLKQDELTPDFLKVLKDTFHGPSICVHVEDSSLAADEYYNTAGELVREGVTVPKGKERDPLYTAPNIRRMNESLHQINEGKIVKKTFAELQGIKN